MARGAISPLCFRTRLAKLVDVGDFRAYLQDTGVVTDVVPATTQDQPARKEEGR